MIEKSSFINAGDVCSCLKSILFFILPGRYLQADILLFFSVADSHLYQSFFIRNCNSFSANGMECMQHDIVFKTLVYLHPPDVSDEVGTKYIRAKGSCALSTIQNR